MTATANSDRDLRIARLFNVLWHGERIACAIAMRQARVCREPRARRFFALQATQEDTHHAFGCRWVRRSSSAALPALAASARDYLDLGTRLLAASEDLFGYGLSTSASCDAKLRAALPEALRTEQA